MAPPARRLHYKAQHVRRSNRGRGLAPSATVGVESAVGARCQRYVPGINSPAQSAALP
jgi:hypothetical protein